MIVNSIDYLEPDAGGEPSRVVPVRAMLCTECQTQYATVYRFWIAVVVLLLLALMALCTTSMQDPH
jgi:hypothetical protein